MIGPDGALYFCEIDTHWIRCHDRKTGAMRVVAVNGQPGTSRDGQPTTQAPLQEPYELRFHPNGDLYFVDMTHHKVCHVDRKTGLLHPVAGTGEPGFSGDGGPAREAPLNGPEGIAVGPRHNLYGADTENHVIRRNHLDSSSIDTVAGTGKPGDGPDGHPLRCAMNRPCGVFAAANGALWVGDREAHRIRVLLPAE